MEKALHLHDKNDPGAAYCGEPKFTFEGRERSDTTEYASLVTCHKCIKKMQMRDRLRDTVIYRRTEPGKIDLMLFDKGIVGKLEQQEDKSWEGSLELGSTLEIQGGSMKAVLAFIETRTRMKTMPFTKACRHGRSI